MTLDLTKIILSSTASSLKVLKEGSGSLTIPGFTAPGEATGTATIAHGYGEDGLLFQVSSDGGTSPTTDATVLPWESNDGQVILYAYLNSTNLVIVGIDSSVGAGPVSARTISYYYRIFIP